MKKLLSEKERLETEDKLFNFRPIFFIAVALCLGIVFAYFRYSYGITRLWALLPVGCAGIPFLFCSSLKRLRAVAFAFAMLCIAFLVGTFSFRTQIVDYQKAEITDGESAYVTGRVLERTERSYATQITIDDVLVDGKAVKGKLVAYIPATYGEKIRISDCVLLFGNIQNQTDIFDEYGFKGTQIHENIRYRIETDKCQIVGKSNSPFLRLRNRMQSVLQTGMDETPASVTFALLTGDSTQMDGDLLKNVRYGGIAHIFAVSGLHVGALYAFCLWLTGKTALSKLPKFLRFALVACTLLFYGGVCGYTSSVMRASVMCLVFYASKLIGLKADFLECIGLSAVIVLLVSPVALFTVGFQLSFGACLGIALWTKPIKKQLQDIFGGNGSRRVLENGDSAPPTLLESARNAILSFVAVTLSAQVATAPILLYSFGFLSVWSVLLNCIFVPLISGLFACILALTLICCVLPISASVFILKVPSLLFSALLLAFQVLDFSKLAITGVPLGLGGFLGYYGACVFLTDKWNIHKGLKWTLAGVCALVFALTL